MAAVLAWARRLTELALAAGSAGAERKHPLHVPGHCNEAPLTADIVEPAQQELTESHHRFDDPEHRFRGLFAQGVEFFALWCPQTVGHGLDGRRVFRRRRRSGKPLAQGLMMWLTAECNQRLDFGGLAERHIGLAEIAIVGQQRFGPAE